MLLAYWIRLFHRSGIDAPSSDQSAHLQALRQSGLTRFGQLVPLEHVANMLRFLDTRMLVSLEGQRFYRSSPQPGVAIASYPVRTVLECPHVLELMNSPPMLQLASRYLGCQPTISGLRIDWMNTTDGPPADVQQFHRDYDDWRFLKLFVYLTDIDAQSGPHEYVLTSHLGAGRLHARPYAEAEIIRKYGATNLLQVMGTAGTGFMVDTWGIHKGNIPQGRARILLQVQYSILPVLRFDYQPADIAPSIAIDRYTNRLLIA
jgi:hypothetical protein